VPAGRQVFLLPEKELPVQYKAEIMDEAAVVRSLKRMTHEILERNKGTSQLLLMGIKRRGLPLAKEIAANIRRFEDADVPVGYLDITLYRDDLSELTPLPDAADADIPVSVAGKNCVLIDDVIYTGRTARAAMEGILRHGRPASIQLAVLVDRGHREMPIRPDFVGKNIPTSREEIIAVTVPDIDGVPYSVKLFQL
jgi:pyrimidine operon attenuation protein / uracil phosphoribosyltransferase